MKLYVNSESMAIVKIIILHYKVLNKKVYQVSCMHTYSSISIWKRYSLVFQLFCFIFLQNFWHKPIMRIHFNCLSNTSKWYGDCVMHPTKRQTYYHYEFEFIKNSKIFEINLRNSNSFLIKRFNGTLDIY